MKGYYEVQLTELVERAGGKETLKYHEEHGRDPYQILLRIQDKYIIYLLHDYREVGEVFPSEIMDYCDNLYRG
jgi:hypothetical protein